MSLFLCSITGSKIVVQNPVVDLDGDEMTRYGLPDALLHC